MKTGLTHLLIGYAAGCVIFLLLLCARAAWRALVRFMHSGL